MSDGIEETDYRRQAVQQPHALTREQVEYVCQHAVIDGHYSTRVSAAYTIKEHDAAQRETIRRLEQQIEMLKECLEENKKHAASLQARLTAIEARTRSITEAVLAAFGWELNLDSGGKDGTLFRRTDWKTSPAPIVYAMTVEEILQHGYPIHQPKKWTTARPTVAGWYWWRKGSGYSNDMVAIFYEEPHSEWKARFLGLKGGKIGTLPVNVCDGEWQGPLTPGEE